MKMVVGRLWIGTIAFSITHIWEVTSPPDVSISLRTKTIYYTRRIICDWTARDEAIQTYSGVP
jgi:hypothetical protein